MSKQAIVATAHLRQAQGFDLQVVGFGKSEVYHGDNEYTLLSDMRDAMIILSQVGTAVCCGALVPGASSTAPMSLSRLLCSHSVCLSLNGTTIDWCFFTCCVGTLSVCLSQRSQVVFKLSASFA